MAPNNLIPLIGPRTNVPSRAHWEWGTSGRSYLQERRYRRIQRAFTLPTPVNESKVDANLKDGVLHLTLEKSKESMPHEIAVK